MHDVYILESVHDARHWYVGVTSDLERRLEEHNAGDSIHTNKFRPWKIKNAIAFEARDRAEQFEKNLKSKSGRAFSKKHL